MKIELNWVIPKVINECRINITLRLIEIGLKFLQSAWDNNQKSKYELQLMDSECNHLATAIRELRKLV